MSSLFESTYNTRAIIPGSLKYIRSDAPYKLTDDELGWLRANNITTVIDLRSESECKACPSILASAEGFSYRNMPVSGGNAVPKTPADVPKSYIAMLDSQMDDIINTILSAETNVLYFCSAGKDRTGVVTAVLLQKLGYSTEYIIEDYLQSGKELHDILQAYGKSGAADINVITPQRSYIKGLLDYLRYDSFKDWMKDNT